MSNGVANTSLSSKVNDGVRLVFFDDFVDIIVDREIQLKKLVFLIFFKDLISSPLDFGVIILIHTIDS